MTDQPIPTSRRSDLEALLDAVHRQPPVQGESAPAGARRAGMYYWTAGRPPDPRRRRGPVVRERRPRPPRDRRGRRAAARDAGLRATVPDGTSGRVRARQRGSRASPPAGSTMSSSPTRAPSPSTRRSRSRSRITACRARRTRTRLIGRERGYHGVGFGGISVGGMVTNRKACRRRMLPGVDHLPHTHDLARNAFTRGLPAARRRARR